MGDACSVAGAICCRLFTAADPDQISAAKLKMPCGEEAWCDIAEKAEKWTAIMSIGHRSAVVGLHQRHLEMGPEGDHFTVTRFREDGGGRVTNDGTRFESAAAWELHR